MVDQILGAIDPTVLVPYTWHGHANTNKALHLARELEQAMSEHGYNLNMGQRLHLSRLTASSGVLCVHETFSQDDDSERSYTFDLPPLASVEFAKDGMAPPPLPDIRSPNVFGKQRVSEAGISPPCTTTVSESSKRSSKRVNLGPPTSEILYEKTWEILLPDFL
jgi:hypothetical protein